MNTQWFLKCICTDTTHHINKPLFRLGRHRDHDIVCSSVVISREHANFIIESDNLYVKDLGSSNGTYVNGQRITQKKSEKLNNSDIVSFGYSEHTKCDNQGCFIYEVQCSPTTAEICNMLEDQEASVQNESHNVASEAILGYGDVNQTSNDDHINVQNTSKSVNHVEDVNIKIEPMDNSQSLELQNVSYSIEDSIIVINDEVEDSHELAASQLFPIHDPYLKIKEELTEFDEVRERPPILVESDDDDFDILELLMQDIPNIEGANSGSNDVQCNNMPDETETTNGNGVENNDREDLVTNNILNTVCCTNGDSNKSLGHNNKPDNIMVDENYVNGKSNGLNEHIDIRVNNIDFPTTSGSYGTKYSKPPIIEPPVLTKSTRQSSKSKENKPSPKRKSSSSHEKETDNKKQKTSNTIDSPSTSTGKYTSTRSNKRKTLTKDDKLKIKEERKVKLKEIYVKPAREANNQRQSKTASKVGKTKPCVKVSKNRGEFMLDNNSSSPQSNKKRVEVVSVNTRKNLSEKNQPVTRSSSNQPITKPIYIEPSTSNDPRFKNNIISVNGHVSTDIAALNNKESIFVPNFKNNNIVPSTRDANKNREVVNHCKSIFSQPSFNNILNILNWRTQWLEEQKMFPTYPPVNKRAAVKMCNSFANHTDYCIVVLPLLMIELWHELYEDWRSIDTPAKQIQRKFKCIITEVQIRPNYFILKCTAYTTKQQNILKQHVRECSVVFVQVPTRKDLQDSIYPVFGFVENCEKRSLKGNDFVDEYLSKQLRPNIPDSILHFDILIKPIASKICINKCMDGAILIALVSQLREFNAVYNLESSPLSKLILDPTIEDYLIPRTILPNIKAMDKLNELQASVVQETTALCLGNAPGIYLMQGPPGTGKTTVIKNIVKSVILDNPEKKLRLLLTAPSNSAVDSLALKIIKELRTRLSEDERRQIRLVRVGPMQSVNEEVKPYLLDQFSKCEVTKTFLNEHPEVKRDFHTLHAKKNTLRCEYEKRRELGENVDELKEKLVSVEHEYEHFARNYMKQAMYQKALDTARKRVLGGSNIICTTLSSCTRLKDFNRTISIDCCIVDEATQSKEAETLIPLTLGVNKLILVGDPQQLPAVTISKYAKELEHGQSLFQRIKKLFDGKPSNPIRMLNIQHRMHPAISYFPSNTFYNGELRNSESCIDRDQPCKIKPYYVFNLNLSYNQAREWNTNDKEVQCVRKLIESINNILMGEKNQRQINIGVITPYNSQKDALLRQIDSSSFSSNISITINTVDSFQGLEKDIIIVSCVRYTPNIFLGDEQRLNVAITRAKHALYIVGTYSLFQNCELLNRLKTDATKRKLYSNISAISTSSLERMIKR